MASTHPKVSAQFNAETIGLINQHFSWLSLDIGELLHGNSSQEILERLLDKALPFQTCYYGHMCVNNAHELNYALRSAQHFSAIMHRAGCWRMLSAQSMAAINKLPLIVRSITYTLAANDAANPTTLQKLGEEKIVSD